jgi:hypothetical protein
MAIITARFMCISLSARRFPGGKRHQGNFRLGSLAGQSHAVEGRSGAIDSGD